jgi:hypothetical protein
MLTYFVFHIAWMSLWGALMKFIVPEASIPAFVFCYAVGQCIIILIRGVPWEKGKSDDKKTLR